MMRLDRRGRLHRYLGKARRFCDDEGSLFRYALHARQCLETLRARQRVRAMTLGRPALWVLVLVLRRSVLAGQMESTAQQIGASYSISR